MVYVLKQFFSISPESLKPIYRELFRFMKEENIIPNYPLIPKPLLIISAHH